MPRLRISSSKRSLAAVVAVLLLPAFFCLFCAVLRSDGIGGREVRFRQKPEAPRRGGCGDWPSGYASGSALYCSFNGACLPSGECSCFLGWRGPYCETLDLAPASNGSGLMGLLHGESTSTWGGSVVWDEATGLYHMFASEISHRCGIKRWVSNSVVVRATSRGERDGWRFERAERLWGLFSHEPIAARDPGSGEVAVFLTHYPGDASDCPVCICEDGNSASGDLPGCRHECGGGTNKTLYSYFSFASDLGEGSRWSNLTSLRRVQTNPHVDMNLAPIIHANGSLLAWTRWDIWEAADWKDPETYVDTGQAPDFDSKPYPTPWEGEDPSLWRDRDGIYHMISHNGERGKMYPRNASGDCGRHYFSETGKAGTWRVAPMLPPEDLGGCAYPREVPFVDGNAYTFYRRERPHLVIGPDGYTPVALSTSVIDSPEDDLRDASYTLIQPIRAAARTGIDNVKSD